MPARGTHSLEPLPRGRGLRLAGSWSNVASTQSAMASAVGAIMREDDSQMNKETEKKGGRRILTEAPRLRSEGSEVRVGLPIWLGGLDLSWT